MSVIEANPEGVKLYSGTTLVSSGAVMTNIALRGKSVNSMYVSSGGLASSAAVSSGGYLRIYSGGSAQDTAVYSQGQMYVSSGGKQEKISVGSRGTLYLYHSGEQLNFSVSSGGSVRMSGGAAQNGFVLGGGVMNVSSGAYLCLTEVQSGGSVMLYSGADVYETTVLTGGVLNGFKLTSDHVLNDGFSISGGIVSSGYRAYLYQEQQGVNVIVESAGSMSLNGGALKDVQVKNKGYLLLSSGSAVGNTVSSGGSMNVGKSAYADNSVLYGGAEATVSSGGVMHVLTAKNGVNMVCSSGARLCGTMVLEEGASVSLLAGAEIVFSVNEAEEPGSPALISGFSQISGAENALYSVIVHEDQTYGKYALASDAAGFSGVISVYNEAGTYWGDVSLSTPLVMEEAMTKYSLSLRGETLSFGIVSTNIPRCNLKENGCSQIVAWDSAQGKVGYVNTDGKVSPQWCGIWEWAGEEAKMWKVVGVGHFAGSETDQDGILLYNGYGNTFAAWTDLNDPSYGYISLCHVEGNFQTKCTADFDGNGFDDVIICDENGSVGIVSDAAAYHDVWHSEDPETNDWQLIGAGRFSGSADSIVFRQKSTGAFFLWDNQDPTYSEWNWKQTYIGTLDNSWECVAIGDFHGDGIDDIVMKDASGNLFAWENGDVSNQRYVGTPGEGFLIESVGDYNRDGKEDLLLRENASGWGGLGYWASGDASNWTDLNARVETDMESRFAIVK